MASLVHTLVHTTTSSAPSTRPDAPLAPLSHWRLQNGRQRQLPYLPTKSLHCVPLPLYTKPLCHMARPPHTARRSAPPHARTRWRMYRLRLETRFSLGATTDMNRATPTKSILHASRDGGGLEYYFPG